MDVIPSIINNDGIKTSVVRVLPDGRFEVAFDTCNRTKICTSSEYLSGKVSDYFKTPGGQDFVQYHVGERRRQSNGNIAVVIGGTGRTLLVKDEVTGAQTKSTYKAFYYGNSFGTGALKTAEQIMSEKRAVKAKQEKVKSRTYDLHNGFIFNGIEVLMYGNKIKGYIPCVKMSGDKYKVYNIDNKCEELMTLDEMSRKLNRFRDNNAKYHFDSNFFVGTKLMLKPFNIPCTVTYSYSANKTYQVAWVKLDGTDLKCKCDMEDAWVSLRTFSTKLEDRCVADGENYKVTDKGVLLKVIKSLTPLLLRNPRIVDGTYVIDITYKVSGTESDTKTETVSFEGFDSWVRSKLYDKQNGIKRVNEW